MSLHGLIRRASSLLGAASSQDKKHSYADGEIVFSKNNVCVHTPSQCRGDANSMHHPGYLVVRCRHMSSISEDNEEHSADRHTTLTLTWIPNDKLARNHDLIAQLHPDACHNGNVSRSCSPCLFSEADSISISSYCNTDTQCSLSITSKSFEEESTALVTDTSTDGATLSIHQHDLVNAAELPLDPPTSDPASVEEGIDLSTSLAEGSSTHKADDDRKKAEEDSDTGVFLESGSSLSTECRDMVAQMMVEDGSPEKNPIGGDFPSSSNSKDVVSNGEDSNSLNGSPEPSAPPYQAIFEAGETSAWYESSAESMAYNANLFFPESSNGTRSLPSHRSQRTTIFSVDLGEMRSLRLFFSDSSGTRGQLVIASRESQYKILHFHHTGLDKLANVFEDWNFLVPPKERDDDCTEDRTSDGANERRHSLDSYKQFSVCRPSVGESELHPDEGSVSELDAEDWLSYFSKEGIIEDDLSLRRRIFFGGLEPQLRSSVWPFLLRCYPYTSNFNERQTLADNNNELYESLTKRREALTGQEKDDFYRSIQCTVEKDVIRTDRNNPNYAGNDNPNLTKMKNILLNFALYRPDIGYTQGMSDIVSPILSEVRVEPDVFWCFVGLMSKTIFVTSPTDTDMEKNLSYLRELLRLMAPSFHHHLLSQQDGGDLLFCHRWILLCFKREFDERSVLSLWEKCWSNYQTDYFHLFVAVAVVCVYGSEVTSQSMRPDETLLYFTSLGHHMDASIVIKKARGLLHSFRSMAQIPCTLVGLCELCGPGMWDSGHNPTVVCEGHSEEECPRNNRVSS